MSKYKITRRGKLILTVLVLLFIFTPVTIVAIVAISGWDSPPGGIPPQASKPTAEQIGTQQQVRSRLDYFPDEVWTVAGTGNHGAIDGYPAQFNLPTGIFSSGDGTLYIADTMNNLIRSIDIDMYVQRVTGEILVNDEHNFPQGFYMDTEIDTALFNRPTDVAVDERGWIFITDSENNAIRVIAGQRVYTFAGSAESGHVDGSSSDARFNLPTAIAICPQGNLYVADTLNHAIRMIDADGNVTTIAGTPGTYGFSDGTVDEALFNRPGGIAVSQDGRIYVADTGNHLIRVIEQGEVRTLAGTLRFMSDITWYENTDIDDEPLGGFEDGFEAMFNTPTGLSIWYGNLIVADSLNHMIRAILPTGETITIAGIGYPEYINASPDQAAFHLPRGVYVRGNRLYIADTGNNLIRAMELEHLLERAE